MTSLVLRKVIEGGAVKLKLARTSLVVRRVISRGVPKLKLVLVGRRVISEGVLKPERVQVICPGCGQQVEAVAWDGQVKGYCAVARQYVDFLIETQRVPTGKQFTAETRAKISAGVKKRWQDPEYRAKIVGAHTGKHFSTETREKMSAALAESRAKQSAFLKKRWQNPEFRAKAVAAHTGRHLTDETKAKISTTLKRRHKAERGANERSVLQ